MFRRPSLGLAEITWRWSFGFAVASLLTLSCLEYLDTLPVTRGEMLLLRSRQPALISRAIADIFRGSAPRVVEVGIVLAATMAMAWIVLASLGRAATLQALLRYFREYAATLGVVPAAESVPQTASSRLRSLCGLNFFRVGVTLAAVVGCLGALLLAGAASPEKDPSPWSALLVFMVLTMLVWLAWSALNWFLSLATVFVVGRGRDTFGAVASTVDLCRAHAGPVFAAGTWFGLTHLAAFVIASSVVMFPLAFIGLLPPPVVLGGVLLITLLYFAVVDFLYVGRLAAYVAIVELPEAPPAPAAPLLSPPSQSATVSPPPAPCIDQDELILSDVGGAGTRQSALGFQPAASIDKDEAILSDLAGDAAPPEPPQD
ncbi:MAG TPA: hypothetical protein VMT28_05470 [Terriglobales bacterium]|jgi:hypothetical protein|nr:hypothetical protein [Terriglobales bacterium]